LKKGHAVIPRIVLLASLALTTLAPRTASAAYDANMVGVVTDLLVYPDANIILIRLNNQPTSHRGCNPAYFELFNVSEPMFGRLYARLLAAKLSGEAVNIGFDSVGTNCRLYIPVHRVG
jgi:hypothetical protein